MEIKNDNIFSMIHVFPASLYVLSAQSTLPVMAVN